MIFCSDPPELVGGVTPQKTSSPLYHTGTRCPHHIWRLMHQSRRLSIQWKYVFSNRSGMISIEPSRTTVCITSLRLIVFFHGMIPRSFEDHGTAFLFTSMNHCSLICGSIAPP